MGHISRFCLSVIPIVLFFIGVLRLSSPVQGNKAPSRGTSISDAKIVLNIPRGGLTSDRVQEVSLTGSEVLLVVDETNGAVFMPQDEKATEAKQDESLNKFVYAVENGKCNSGKTLTYEQIFPGLDVSCIGSLWEKATQSCEGSSQKPSGASTDSATVTDYLFTSPPSDKLQGKKVSFCVQFYSAASVTTTTTQATTTASTKSETVASPTASAPPSTSEAPSQPTPNPVIPPNPGSSGSEGSDVEQTQAESGEKDQASFPALRRKDAILSGGPARGKVNEKENEGSVNVLESKGGKMVREKATGAYSSRESGSGEGETGYYLTVIIHSSPSKVNFGMVTSFLVFISSLPGILRAASFF